MLMLPPSASDPLPRTMCTGLGGAVGYALGGLDWTHTFLGAIFKSQEQILFVFAAILFSISVVLHLFSIEEQPYSNQHDKLDQVPSISILNDGISRTSVFHYVSEHAPLAAFPPGEPRSQQQATFSQWQGRIYWSQVGNDRRG